MRLLQAAAVAFLLLAAGCSGGGDAVIRPTSVPAGARLVAQETSLGSPASSSNDQHLFDSTECADGVMTITTSREALFAELPCDRALPAAVANRFREKPVRIRIVPGENSKLYIDSDVAGTVEFTPGHVWLQPR